MKKPNIETEKYKKLSPSKNYYLSLCSSIIYQQISTKAGDSIYKKFLKLFKNKNPTPKLFLIIPEIEIKRAGISPQKLSYLKDLAEKFINKTIDEKNIYKMKDEEIIEHLMQVKGIGNWTAQMFLIFGLNKKNVLPCADLGIRKGFQKVYKLKKLPSDKQIKKVAKFYEGNLTKYSMFLWSSLHNT